MRATHSVFFVVEWVNKFFFLGGGYGCLVDSHGFHGWILWMDAMDGWLVGWLVGWMVGWLVGWLVGWMTGLWIEFI